MPRQAAFQARFQAVSFVLNTLPETQLNDSLAAVTGKIAIEGKTVRRMPLEYAEPPLQAVELRLPPEGLLTTGQALNRF